MVDILNSGDLLEQQLEEASNKGRLKRAKSVELSKQTGITFNAQLQQMVRMIRQDVNEQLVPLLRELAPQYERDGLTLDAWPDDIIATLRLIVDKWRSPTFRNLGEQIAAQFVTTADKVNRERFEASLGGFGFDLFADSPELVDYINVSIADNTRLIMSIPDQYLTNVESIVMSNVRAGNRPSAITKLLSDQFGVTQNRAKLIARDQTAKVNGDLSARRQTAAGFEYFQWLDSGDSRVRERHEDITDRVTAYGKGVYRWDNPPLSDRGTPIIPGEDFQCRCTARPVTRREVEENQAAGSVNPGVKR